MSTPATSACLTIGASFVLAAFARAAAQDPAPDTRPNVVLIVADDLDVGVDFDSKRTDNHEYAYPNLRAIRDRGVLFTQSFVSLSLCAPSRASILTGQYAHNHGVMSNSEDSSEFEILERAPTLATWLQAAGYTTSLVGKYLNGYNAKIVQDGHVVTAQGWSHWYALCSPIAYYDWSAIRDGKLEPHGAREYLTDALAHEAVHAIDVAAQEHKPFFLMLNFFAPHDSHEGVTPLPVPAQRHFGAFQDFVPNFPPSYDEEDVSDKPKVIAELRRVTWKLEIIRRARARRESMIAVDEAIGGVLKALDAHELTARTVVMFMSDNGFQQGEHRLVSGKERPYEESIRVPLIACGPQIPVGATCAQMVLNIDLAPTITELAHATAQREMDGRSWLTLLREPTTPWRHDFLITGVRGGPFTGVRTQTRVYVEYDPDMDGVANERELYWLQADERNSVADPYELNSLHADPRFADVVAAMHARLEALRKCHGDSCWQ